jgi:flagellin
MGTLNIQSGVTSLNAFQQRRQQREDSHHTKRMQDQLQNKRSGQWDEGPISLVIPPKLLAQVAGLTRIIVDGEAGISMVQTAEAALHEILRLLQQMKELASYAAQGVEHNLAMREADQREMENLLQSIDHIAEATKYGAEKLLDGSHEVHGVTTGEYLEFVSASANTQTAPVTGYTVYITQAPSPATLVSKLPLTEDLIRAGEQIFLREQERTLRFQSRPDETYEHIVERLNRMLQSQGMPLRFVPRSDHHLEVEHLVWGRSSFFEAASSTPGLLSDRNGAAQRSRNGTDVQGLIDGVDAIGEGTHLSAPPDAERISGLKLRFTGRHKRVELPLQGAVSVFQNALQFHTQNQNPLRLNMRSVYSSDLARHVANASGFENLSDLDVASPQGGRDALQLTEQAIQEIQQLLDEIRGFRTRQLQQRLELLRDEHLHLLPDEQLLANDQQAQEVAHQMSELLKSDTKLGRQAQASHTPHSLQSLLD